MYALNRSLAIRYFEHGCVIKIHGRIIYDFYMGLSDISVKSPFHPPHL